MTTENVKKVSSKKNIFDYPARLELGVRASDEYTWVPINFVMVYLDIAMQSTVGKVSDMRDGVKDTVDNLKTGDLRTKINNLRGLVYPRKAMEY
jgi:hypothetical protein